MNPSPWNETIPLLRWSGSLPKGRRVHPRIIKEARALLPAFGITLLATVLPGLIWPEAEVGPVLFGVGCALMGASSFGNEFQGRTLPLLLVQPVARRKLWLEKMLVLGTALALCFATLLATLRAPGQFLPVALTLAVIPLCVFCTTPCMTLITRSTLLGAVSSCGPPMTIAALFWLIVWAYSLGPWLQRHPELYPYTAIPAVIYCALFYRAGFEQFLQLQAVDSQAQELGLPSRLEAALARPLKKLAPGYTGPFASLIRKELRLQQINFLGAGLFCAVAAIGALLYQCHIMVGGDNVAEPFLVTDFVIYLLLLPFIAGAIGVAEEKAWGVTDWQLTLPVSALKQWSTKIVVGLSTSLVLGLLLPAAVALVVKEILGLHPGESFLPPLHVMVAIVIGHLLLTSLAIYAACHSRTTVGAILLALGMILLAGCAVRIGILMLELSVHYDFWIDHDLPNVSEAKLTHLGSVGLVILLCLVQRSAFVCYRSRGMTVRQGALQALVLFAVVCLLPIALTTAGELIRLLLVN